MAVAHLDRVFILIGEEQKLLKKLERFADLSPNDGSQCLVDEESWLLKAGGLFVLLVDGLAWGLVDEVGLDDDGSLAVHLSSVHDKIIKSMGKEVIHRPL